MTYTRGKRRLKKLQPPQPSPVRVSLVRGAVLHLSMRILASRGPPVTNTPHSDHTIGRLSASKPSSRKRLVILAIETVFLHLLSYLTVTLPRTNVRGRSAANRALRAFISFSTYIAVVSSSVPT